MTRVSRQRKTYWPASSQPVPSRSGTLKFLAADLAEELAGAWHRGACPRAEDLLARHPELSQDSEAALRVVYEEICLRRDLGERVASQEFVSRFPQWEHQVEAIFDCDRFVEGPEKAVRFPEVREALGGFQLLAELGRGALGCVFLAKQPALADRAVVLKITGRSGLEYLSLARLQHTHIVPLYGVEDFLAQDLRVLCMPYLGGAPLSQLLEDLRSRPFAERVGQDLLTALDRAQDALPIAIPTTGPARFFIASASYVRVMCWIAACLADALQFAHERGLLHLDLKPSNVLLAADGQPLLLDFHLAREPLEAATDTPGLLGGTPGYMSPEQVLATAAIRWNRPVPKPVDHRSDIYSLGLLLYESLGGCISPVRAVCLTELRQLNPHVTVGLSDVLAKCLAHDPSKRYASAALVAADLRRYLSDLPLVGVANRSVRERWSKWRRRRPYVVALAAMLLAVVVAGATACAVAWSHTRERLRQAEVALVFGRQHLQNRDPDKALQAFTYGLAAARNVPWGDQVRQELNAQSRLATKMKAADDLHAAVDHVRFFFDPDSLSSKQLQALEAGCRTRWEFRGLLTDRDGIELGPDIRRQIEIDLLDLAILWVEIQVRLSPEGKRPEARQKAAQLLGEAETLFGENAVLSLERQSYATAFTGTGRKTEAARLVPRSAWEHYALGRYFLRLNELSRAAAVLEQAIQMHPENLWPRLFYGICALRLKQHHDAVCSFTACIALAPCSATCYYNRALAETALGQLDRALLDYGLALTHDPTLGVAYLNRGVLYFRDHRYVEAIADLEKALTNGADVATVHYNLALVYLAQKNRNRAFLCARRVLEQDRNHAGAAQLVKQIKSN